MLGQYQGQSGHLLRGIRSKGSEFLFRASVGCERAATPTYPQSFFFFHVLFRRRQ
jgi:hypothetical protein